MYDKKSGMSTRLQEHSKNLKMKFVVCFLALLSAVLAADMPKLTGPFTASIEIGPGSFGGYIAWDPTNNRAAAGVISPELNVTYVFDYTNVSALSGPILGVHTNRTGTRLLRPRSRDPPTGAMLPVQHNSLHSPRPLLGSH